MQHGWTLTDPNPSFLPYYNRRNELSTSNGCVLWGSRVIIPPAGHNILLSQLHDTTSTHPGVSKMKSLARCFIWWPGLDTDRENSSEL